MELLKKVEGKECQNGVLRGLNVVVSIVELCIILPIVGSDPPLRFSGPDKAGYPTPGRLGLHDLLALLAHGAGLRPGPGAARGRGAAAAAAAAALGGRAMCRPARRFTPPGDLPPKRRQRLALAFHLELRGSRPGPHLSSPPPPPEPEPVRPRSHRGLVHLNVCVPTVPFGLSIQEIKLLLRQKIKINKH